MKKWFPFSFSKYCPHDKCNLQQESLNQTYLRPFLMFGPQWACLSRYQRLKSCFSLLHSRSSHFQMRNGVSFLKCHHSEKSKPEFFDLMREQAVLGKEFPGNPKRKQATFRKCCSLIKRMIIYEKSNILKKNIKIIASSKRIFVEADDHTEPKLLKWWLKCLTIMNFRWNWYF